MKKSYVKSARLLSASILLGSLAGISAPVIAQEVITPDVTISADETVAGLTLDGDKIYQIDAGFTYTVTGSVTGGTLTKTGAGTLALGGTGNSSVTVEAGKLLINSHKDDPCFTGELTVLSGATVELNAWDSLGYRSPSQVIRLYGGTLDKNLTVNSNVNETLGYVDLYMRAGKLTATNGYFDLLRPESRIFVEAEDTATADTPTESTISARLNFRTGNGMSATNGVAFNVAENALLTVSGQLTGGKATDLNLIKTGTGTMVVSNQDNSYLGMTQVNEGVLKVTGKLGTGTVTVASGATLDLQARESIRGELIINGNVIVNAAEGGGKGAISSTSVVTVNTGGTLTLNTGDALGYTAGNPSMINLNGGTMTSTANVHYSIGNFTLSNGGMITDGGYKNGNNLSFILDGTIIASEGTSRFESTGTTQYRSSNNNKNTVFQVNEGATLNVKSQFNPYRNNEGYTLTKTGAGTMVFERQGTSSGTLIIEEGTVQFKRVDDSRNWNGDIYIREGAELKTEKDSLGYSTNGVTNLYLAGKLNVAGDNESLINVNFYMQGGEIVGNSIHILDKDVLVQSMATEGATVENPTISTINTPINLRETLNNTADFTFMTAENSVLNMKGNIYEGNDSMTVGIHKTGDGTLVLSNANNTFDSTTFMVDAGTLRVENDAIKTLSALTMAEGAILDIVAVGKDFGSIAGQMTLADNVTLAFSSDEVFTMEDFDENGQLKLFQTGEELITTGNINYDLSGLKFDFSETVAQDYMTFFANNAFYLAPGGSVPEPATWVMLVFGVGMGTIMVRRRGRK